MMVAIAPIFCGCVLAAVSLQALAGAVAAKPADAASRRTAAPAAVRGPGNPTGYPTGYPFSFESLLADARKKSAGAYAPRKNSVPVGLDKLSPEAYRSIHFNPEFGIWRADALPFRLELLRAHQGSAQTTVTVSTVEDGVATDLVATQDMFQMAQEAPLQVGKVTLPLSGFRIRSRLNSPKIWDEFLVFQGASYFRAVAKNLLYGLSARGLAVNTAEPSGEEFPAFTHFWVERPAPKAAAVVIYALLESESCTGAYKFTVTPGEETNMAVELTLFPRVEMRSVGIAPLTSMFLFDETNRGHLDDYRPEVHDSDGLLLTTHGGEHIFRPLANPVTLQVSTFTTQPPQGFGLVQRSRNQIDFQDFDAQYERRPSTWIEPQGDWGAGAIELVEIPSQRYSNDNIVAFWRPAQPLPAGHPVHFAYRLSWLADPALPKGLGRTVATRSGASLDGKRRVFLLDIVGAGEKVDGLRLDVSASTGKIVNSTLMSNSALHGLRASFEVDPGDAELVELRLRVMRGDDAATETWLYRWTPG